MADNVTPAPASAEPATPASATPATPASTTPAPAVPVTPATPETQEALDEKYMRLALEEAAIAAAEGEVPIGAVVVHDGEVIARAHNRREVDKDPSAHAEFSAMVAAARVLGRWRLTGCTVYVTLEPCLMCAGLMVNARIDRCVYGARDPKGGATGTLYDVSHDPRLNHEFVVTSGVLKEECSIQLREFFRARRKAAKAARLARAAAAGMTVRQINLDPDVFVDAVFARLEAAESRDDSPAASPRAE